MSNLNFGQKLFTKITGADTWDFHGIGLRGSFDRLLDHGFIADRACVWDKRLEGHEIAFVARTYNDDEMIENPPNGLRIVRLPAKFMGQDDLGTPIAAVIEGWSHAVEDILTGCATGMPADMLAYVLSIDMINDGFVVALDTKSGVINYPAVRIIKHSPAPAWITRDAH